MRELLMEFERALRARNLSASQASMQAVGSKELIREMRRGRVPSVERVRALCEVLDLEFYIGPRRRPSSVDPHRLEYALEAAERGLGSSGRTMDYPSKARFVSAIYDLIGEDSTAAKNAERVLHLIEAMSDNRDTGARTRAAKSRTRSPGRGM